MNARSGQTKLTSHDARQLQRSIGANTHAAGADVLGSADHDVASRSALTGLRELARIDSSREDGSPMRARVCAATRLHRLTRMLYSLSQT